jgi:poly(A) polymerase
MNSLSFSNELNQFEFLKTFSEIADQEGKRIYLVGGFVRDIILHRKRTEMDFLVVGNGPDFAQIAAQSLGIKNISIFRTYGTAHFRYNEFDLEFVGARKESYDRKSRNPIVEDGSFEDDIKRRDFTINSIAVSINRDDFGKVIDTFNGISDIEEKIIRTPLDPLTTFNDDPLRIMRAFRFASQLNFRIEESVNNAARIMKERLKIVSQERISDEFLKIIASSKPSVGLKLLFLSQVMDIVFPEISKMAGVEQRQDYHHKDVFYHTCQVVDNISEFTDDIWLRFAALVHDIAKPATKKFVDGVGWTFHGHEELGARMMKNIFRRMKLPYNKLEYVEKLVRLHLRPIALAKDEVTDSAIRRLIVSAGEDLNDLITLCRADITSKNPDKVSQYLNNYELVMKKVLDVRERDALRAFQSPVSGEVIMDVL